MTLLEPSPPSAATRVRHGIVLVAALMSVLLYLDRFCVGFAVDYIREDMNLTQRQAGWFLSAFFWSYALAQVPAGWLSDRYGARIMLVVYVLTWSVFTALMGGAYSLALLLVTRLGVGLGQAGAYPTAAGVVSKWVPFTGRGFASSIVAVGGRIGGAVAPLLTAWLMLVFVPPGTPVTIEERELLHAPRLGARLAPPDEPPSAADPQVTLPSAAGRRVWDVLPPETQRAAVRLAAEYREQERPLQRSGRAPADEVRPADRAALHSGLNALLDRRDLYRAADFRMVSLPREALGVLRRIEAGEPISSGEVRRFNRLLLEGSFPREIGKLYTRGWRPVVVVYGLAGLAVAALIWLAFRDRPEDHPGCNAAERSLITAGRPPGAPSAYGKAGMVPMRRILASRSLWFVCLLQVGTNFGWLFLVSWMPRYLLDVHQVPILERGLMAGTPLAVGIVGMLLGGWLTDRLTIALGVRWGRRLPMMVTRFAAAAGYGLCLLFSLAGSDSWINSPWMFTLAFSLVACATDLGVGAVWAYKQDVGGRYVGSILGWGNMWGNLGAAVSPLVYDLLLGESPTVAHWNMLFLACMGAFAVSGLCALGVDATSPVAPPDDEAVRPDSAASR